MIIALIINLCILHINFCIKIFVYKRVKKDKNGQIFGRPFANFLAVHLCTISKQLFCLRHCLFFSCYGATKSTSTTRTTSPWKRQLNSTNDSSCDEHASKQEVRPKKFPWLLAQASDKLSTLRRKSRPSMLMVILTNLSSKNVAEYGQIVVVCGKRWRTF